MVDIMTALRSGELVAVQPDIDFDVSSMSGNSSQAA